MTRACASPPALLLIYHLWAADSGAQVLTGLVWCFPPFYLHTTQPCPKSQCLNLQDPEDEHELCTQGYAYANFWKQLASTDHTSEAAHAQPDQAANNKCLTPADIQKPKIHALASGSSQAPPSGFKWTVTITLKIVARFLGLDTVYLWPYIGFLPVSTEYFAPLCYLSEQRLKSSLQPMNCLIIQLIALLHIPLALQFHGLLIYSWGDGTHFS